MKIIIINGPNLNLLGKREPHIYGSRSFEDYLSELRSNFPTHQIDYQQSNHEGRIIDLIQQSVDEYDGIILNAGGYSHTSVAIADAIRSIAVPVIEVHISNVFSREPFRHHSLIAPSVKGVITGFGLDSYRLAIYALEKIIMDSKTPPLYE